MSRIEITFVHLRVLTMAWVAPTTVVVSDEMQFPGQFLVGPESFTQNICNNVCNRRNTQTNKIAFLTCVLNNDRL